MILYKDHIYTDCENDFVKGFQKGEKVKQCAPHVEWKGAGMPLDIIQMALAFFQDIDHEHKGEAQARFFYSLEKRDWFIWAFPQETAGMTTKELEESEEYNKNRAFIPKGYISMGTIHSHCDSSAFQSGTDHQDELIQIGIHITLGKRALLRIQTS